MSVSVGQSDMLDALFSQHQHYISELASAHKNLGKLYAKLTKTEQILSERGERGTTRKETKKLVYTRALSRQSVANLEKQTARLFDRLCQCNDLISSFRKGTLRPAMPPWTGHLPPSPYPYSQFHHESWPKSPPISSYSGYEPWSPPPQYWDLSMLRERRRSSPYGSSVDSGFYEPSMYAQAFHNHEAAFEDTTGHALDHEPMSPMSNPHHAQRTFGVSPTRDEPPFMSLDDGVDAFSLVASAQVGAESSTGSLTRRYSEDALQNQPKTPTRFSRVNSCRGLVEGTSKEAGD